MCHESSECSLFYPTYTDNKETPSGPSHPASNSQSHATGTYTRLFLADDFTDQPDAATYDGSKLHLTRKQISTTRDSELPPSSEFHQTWPYTNSWVESEIVKSQNVVEQDTKVGEIESTLYDNRRLTSISLSPIQHVTSSDDLRRDDRHYNKDSKHVNDDENKELRHSSETDSLISKSLNEALDMKRSDLKPGFASIGREGFELIPKVVAQPDTNVLIQISPDRSKDYRFEDASKYMQSDQPWSGLEQSSTLHSHHTTTRHSGQGDTNEGTDEYPVYDAYLGDSSPVLHQENLQEQKQHPPPSRAKPQRIQAHFGSLYTEGDNKKRQFIEADMGDSAVVSASFSVLNTSVEIHTSQTVSTLEQVSLRASGHESSDPMPSVHPSTPENFITGATSTPVKPLKDNSVYLASSRVHSFTPGSSDSTPKKPQRTMSKLIKSGSKKAKSKSQRMQSSDLFDIKTNMENRSFRFHLRDSVADFVTTTDGRGRSKGYTPSEVFDNIPKTKPRLEISASYDSNSDYSTTKMADVYKVDTTEITSTPSAEENIKTGRHEMRTHRPTRVGFGVVEKGGARVKIRNHPVDVTLLPSTALYKVGDIDASGIRESHAVLTKEVGSAFNDESSPSRVSKAGDLSSPSRPYGVTTSPSTDETRAVEDRGKLKHLDENAAKIKSLLRKYKRKESSTTFSKINQLHLNISETVDVVKKLSHTETIPTIQTTSSLSHLSLHDRTTTQSPSEMFGDQSTRDRTTTQPPSETFGDQSIRDRTTTQSPSETFGDQFIRDRTITKPLPETFGDQSIRDRTTTQPPSETFGDQSIRDRTTTQPPSETFGDQSIRDSSTTQPPSETFGDQSIRDSSTTQPPSKTFEDQSIRDRTTTQPPSETFGDQSIRDRKITKPLPETFGDQSIRDRTTTQPLPESYGGVTSRPRFEYKPWKVWKRNGGITKKSNLVSKILKFLQPAPPSGPLSALFTTSRKATDTPTSPMNGFSRYSDQSTSPTDVGNSFSIEKIIDRTSVRIVEIRESGGKENDLNRQVTKQSTIVTSFPQLTKLAATQGGLLATEVGSTRSHHFASTVAKRTDRDSIGHDLHPRIKMDMVDLKNSTGLRTAVTSHGGIPGVTATFSDSTGEIIDTDVMRTTESDKSILSDLRSEGNNIRVDPMFLDGNLNNISENSRRDQTASRDPTISLNSDVSGLYGEENPANLSNEHEIIGGNVDPLSESFAGYSKWVTNNIERTSHTSNDVGDQMLFEIPLITAYRSLDAINKNRSLVTDIFHHPPSTAASAEPDKTIDTRTTAIRNTTAQSVLEKETRSSHVLLNATDNLSLDLVFKKIQSIGNKIKEVIGSDRSKSINSVASAHKPSEIDEDVHSQAEKASTLPFTPDRNETTPGPVLVNQTFSVLTISTSRNHNKITSGIVSVSTTPALNTTVLSSSASSAKMVTRSTSDTDADRPSPSSMTPRDDMVSVYFESLENATEDQHKSNDTDSSKTGQVNTIDDITNILDKSAIKTGRPIIDLYSVTNNLTTKSFPIYLSDLENKTNHPDSVTVSIAVPVQSKNEKRVPPITLFSANISKRISDAFAKLINLTQGISELYHPSNSKENSLTGEEAESHSSPSLDQSERDVSSQQISQANVIRFSGESNKSTADQFYKRFDKSWETTTGDMTFISTSNESFGGENKNVRGGTEASNISVIPYIEEGVSGSPKYLTSPGHSAKRLKQPLRTLDYALFGMGSDGNFVGGLGESTPHAHAESEGTHVIELTKRTPNPNRVPYKRFFHKHIKPVPVGLPEDGFILHTHTTNLKQTSEPSSTRSTDQELETSAGDERDDLPLEDQDGALPALHIPHTALYDPDSAARETTLYPGAENSSVHLPQPVERYGSPRPTLTQVGMVLTRHWPAVLGVTIGTIFLLTALITSILCRQRR